LISLLVAILKTAEPETNFSFNFPIGSETPAVQLSKNILSLRKIQLKAILYGTKNLPKHLFLIESRLCLMKVIGI
jgi:hypothetical protein